MQSPRISNSNHISFFAIDDNRVINSSICPQCCDPRIALEQTIEISQVYLASIITENGMQIIQSFRRRFYKCSDAFAITYSRQHLAFAYINSCVL